MLDKHDVAAAASGRWREVLLSLCPGLSDDSLSGYHGPCPKCGGTDRFRVFTDFEQSGGAHCNKCLSDRNADGFAFLQWWHNWNFVEALKAVAEYLKLPVALAGSGPKSSAIRAAKPQPQQSADLSSKWKQWAIEAGQLRGWCERWAATKPPVVADSVLDSEVQIGNWPANRDGQVCLGFWGYSGGSAVSLLLYRADGEEFPAFGKLSKRKTHLVGGSKASWIQVGGRGRTSRAKVIWRVEGLPDGLALLPLLPADHAIVTPATGCNWNKLHPDKNPPLDLFADRVVIAIGDADEPGQRGVLRFAAAVAAVASRVLLAQLPYQITDTHGKDLRDWIGDGGDYPGLCDLLRDWHKVSAAAEEMFAVVGDDGRSRRERLANYELAVGYQGDGKQFVPKSMPLIVGELTEMTDGWPRRVGDRLFVHESHELLWINNQASLFGWFGMRTSANVDFVRDGGVFAKSEVFEAMQKYATGYKSVEFFPHEPPIEEHYYACENYPPGDGARINWLLDRFQPETEVDRHLIMLLFATVFWGGPGGQRPAFMITANGRGAGKTTLAMIAAELAGGMIDISQREDIEKIKGRILSTEGKGKRIMLCDNIKATRFSWAELEAMITAPVISGHELYRSESQRPNTMTWIMTMNGVGLSKDIAHRVVEIHLTRPRYSGTWQDDTLSYVREHRREIVGDILAFLRGPRDQLAGNSRWGAWEHQVLARLPMPEMAQELIAARQLDADVDADEASRVEDLIREKLQALHYMPSADVVFLPCRVANKWYNEATGDRVNVTKSTQAIKGWIEEHEITRLRVTRSRRGGRGFYWWGESAPDSGAEICHELEHKIEMESRQPRWGNQDS